MLELLIYLSGIAGLCSVLILLISQWFIAFELLRDFRDLNFKIGYEEKKRCPRKSGNNALIQCLSFSQGMEGNAIFV